MGKPPDFDIDEIIDDKYYCVLADCFWDAVADVDCSNTYMFQAKCCVSGGVLKTFLNDDRECDGHFRICSVSPACAQKVVEISGPYDTYEECDAECS